MYLFHLPCIAKSPLAAPSAVRPTKPVTTAIGHRRRQTLGGITLLDFATLFCPLPPPLAHSGITLESSSHLFYISLTFLADGTLPIRAALHAGRFCRLPHGRLGPLSGGERCSSSSWRDKNVYRQIGDI